jgi:hypothetical protein
MLLIKRHLIEMDMAVLLMVIDTQGMAAVRKSAFPVYRRGF